MKNRNAVTTLLLCAAMIAAPAAVLTGCGADADAGNAGSIETGEVVSNGFIIVPADSDYVKLSSTPDEYGDTLEKLENGAGVGVLASLDGWFQVRHGNHVGYVRSGSVTFSEAEHAEITTAKRSETESAETTETTAKQTTEEPKEQTAAETTGAKEDTTAEKTEQSTENTTEKTTTSTAKTLKTEADAKTYELVFSEEELLKVADLKYEGHVFFTTLSDLRCDNGTATAITDPQTIEGVYCEVEKGIRVTGAAVGDITVTGTLTPYRWELAVPDDPNSRIEIKADAPIEFKITGKIAKN